MPMNTLQDGKDVDLGSIGPAAQNGVDVDVRDYSTLMVWWQLLATVTGADLTGYVTVYRNDGTTSGVNAWSTVRTVAAASDGTNVNSTAQYDVRGLKKVRIRLLNNNVAAKNGYVSYWLSNE